MLIGLFAPCLKGGRPLNDIVDLSDYRQRRFAGLAGQDAARPTTLSFAEWNADERIKTDKSPVVRTSLATILELFQIDRHTNIARRQQIRIRLEYPLLTVEYLTLRDFERRTTDRLMAILGCRVRVVQECTTEGQFLRYIIT